MGRRDGRRRGERDGDPSQRDPEAKGGSSLREKLISSEILEEVKTNSRGIFLLSKSHRNCRTTC